MRPSVAAVLLAALLLGLLPPTSANAPPVVGSIKADLQPPRTFYTVDAADADGDTLNFTWTSTGTCGSFTSTGARAVWVHQHPPCSDETFHPGTITVRVGDGHHADVVRAYTGGSASGTGEAADDPRDEPPPVVVGEEIECADNDAEGVFEPTQGVWQDDEDFADAPGKRLSRNPHFDRWVAELPMVMDKATLLFGIRGDRYHIPYNVTLAGSEIGPARVRFQLVNVGTGELQNVWRWPKDPLQLPIYGECGAPRRSDHKIPVPMGAPDDAPAFRFRTAGEYRIIMELVDAKDAPIPNTQVQLEGRVVDVPETRIRLVGLSLTDGYRNPRPGEGPYLVHGIPRIDTLDASLERIRGEILTFAPDYWPVARGDLEVDVSRAAPGLLDMDAIFERCKEEGAIFNRTAPNIGQFSCVQSYVREKVYSAESQAMWIANARYTALVLPSPSFFLAMRSESGWALGEAGGPKLVIVIESSSHWVPIHEFSHISPYVWKAEGECGKQFHNNGATVANGFRIEVGGAEQRIRREHVHGIMTAASSTEERLVVNGTNSSQWRVWIEQCTYENVLRFLQVPSDPPLQAIALRFLRVDGNVSVGILAGMTMEGTPDVLPGSSGTHAIVLRDAAGAEIRRYGFTPDFATDQQADTPLALVSLRFERPEHAARLEVVGPLDEVLLTRELSAARPRVTVQPLVEHPDRVLDNGTYALRYDAPGATTFSVYVSPDGGATWRTLVPGTNATTVLLDGSYFPAGSTQRIRVVASDGLQSGEATIDHSVAAAGVEVGPSPKSPAPLPPLALVLLVVAAVALFRRLAL